MSEAPARAERLAVFVGEWRTEGRQLAGPVGPAAKITATESYEWLAGQRFLIHRFNGEVGGSDASCIEILGQDADGRYPVHTYYGNGVRNEWSYSGPGGEHGNTWTLTGSWVMGGKTSQVRCTVVFGPGGDTTTATWEMQGDGADWQKFWDVHSTRAAR